MAVKIQNENGQLPEADRLEGFAHPRETTALFGHDEAEQALLKTAKVGRIPHAWLLTGPDGIGKATLAFRFARFILANPNAPAAQQSSDLSIPPDHPVSKQVSALSHPNLLVLRRPWNQKDKRFFSAILVGEVRRLQNFLGLTASGNTWRVIIVDKADDLNENAANALLKSLEEPPSQCVFLLISATPGNVPVTIRSRCRRLALSPLDSEDLSHAVHNASLQAGIETEPGMEKTMLLALADGSVRRALELRSDESAGIYTELVEIVSRLPKLDQAKVLALAERLGNPGADAEFDMFFSMLSDLIHRLVRDAAGGKASGGQEHALAVSLIQPTTLAQWACLWETIKRAKAEARALNLDRKILILETFQKLRETAA